MKFIEIRNMSKSYLKQDVLNGINLVLPSKGMVYLMGESGGGKSTFINCLIGIETMDKGEIYFQGKKIKNFTTFRNKYVGIVYQNINLISFLNVEENINIKKRGKLSQGDTFKIDEYKKTRINFLSGGEAQRVAIKRAINSNCKILLCDEPTGSLDKENAERVNAMAQTSTKSINSSAKRNVSGNNNNANRNVKNANVNKPGSLASKANMVNKFNDSKK